MASIIKLFTESETGITFSLEFSNAERINEPIKIGLDIVNEDKNQSYLDGEMILINKDDAKALIAYLITVFDI